MIDIDTAETTTSYLTIRGTNHQATTTGDCFTVTAFDAGGDTKYEVGGGNDSRPISISFDRDTLWSATTQSLVLQYCSTEVDTSCADYDFDTTGNGIGDTNILLDNGVIELGGVRNITSFNYLRVQDGAGTYVSTASFTICRSRG